MQIVARAAHFMITGIALIGVSSGAAYGQEAMRIHVRHDSQSILLPISSQMAAEPYCRDGAAYAMELCDGQLYNICPEVSDKLAFYQRKNGRAFLFDAVAQRNVCQIK
jgi:hypothetical protein